MMCLSIYVVFIFYISGHVYCESLKYNSSTDNLLDYCYHPDCSLKYQHTMCAAANKQSPRLYASGMTTWMRYQILLLHNRHRDNVAMGLEAGQPPATNMRKMYWDHELENMAEVWARQCQKRHDECRNTIRFNVVQNMDVRPVVPRVTEAQVLADAVDAWFSGARVLPTEQVWSFRLTNCSAPGGCNAHWYSAAAWASTWRIGCSQALCTMKKRSCVPFRKRREKAADATTKIYENVTRTKENILRRTKYMTTATSSRFGDFATMPAAKFKESPLHRGILLSSKDETPRKEPVIIAFTVCNYGPSGNIDGFPIYEAGVTCSNCPQGTSCSDRTHRGLCAVNGDPDIRP